MCSLRKVILVLLFFGLFCFLLSISARAQEAKTCDSEGSFGRSDKILFGKYCGACHTLSGKWNKLVKVPLAGVFERDQLSTGEPANEETVRGIIENGRPVFMPGFRYTLSSKQIDELIRFLKSARCSE